MNYKVVEHFISVNGEGPKAGELALFIRFAGCNINCSYCDTKWANALNVDYVSMTAEDIIKIVQDSGVQNVTLTGGEPLIQKDFLLLLDRMTDLMIHIEIETNGSVSIKAVKEKNYRNVSLTMDYKLMSSHMEAHMKEDNFTYLDQNDALKFVSGSIEDLNRGYELIESYDLTNKTNVYYSPVFGQIEPREIVDFMMEKKLNDVKLQIQLHKIIWDPEMRGV